MKILKKTWYAIYSLTFSILILLSSFTNQPVKLALANPVALYTLKMPEEYINYTITLRNGNLWAELDGIYPLYLIDIECQDQPLWVNYNGFAFDGETLPLVYPTPPNTNNISIKLKETDLKWSNYTQTHPETTHYTAIGDWPMISCTIKPVTDYFILKIHYEHPITQINGSYMFLYDLNISPYLSPWSTKSTAYFYIKFETDITDLNANTVNSDGTLRQLDFTLQEDSETKTVALKIISEYSKPLQGDFLVSFTDNDSRESTYIDSKYSSFSLVLFYAITVAFIAAVILICYFIIKSLRQLKHNSTRSNRSQVSIDTTQKQIHFTLE